MPPESACFTALFEHIKLDRFRRISTHRVELGAADLFNAEVLAKNAKEDALDRL